MLAQIGLNRIVQCHVRLIVEQQVELDLVIARPRQIEVVQIAAVGRDQAGIGDAVRVDSGFTTSQMLSLAASMQRLTVDDVTFLTAPVTGVGQEGEATGGRFDKPLGDHLWHAMASDSMPAFLAEHPELVTAQHVR